MEWYMKMMEEANGKKKCKGITIYILGNAKVYYL